jgi:hypothetical protein
MQGAQIHGCALARSLRDEQSPQASLREVLQAPVSKCQWEYISDRVFGNRYQKKRVELYEAKYRLPRYFAVSYNHMKDLVQDLVPKAHNPLPSTFP